jgi:hypothetical protein
VEYCVVGGRLPPETNLIHSEQSIALNPGSQSSPTHVISFSRVTHRNSWSSWDHRSNHSDFQATITVAARFTGGSISSIRCVAPIRASPGLIIFILRAVIAIRIIPAVVISTPQLFWSPLPRTFLRRQPMLHPNRVCSFLVPNHSKVCHREYHL